MTGPVVQITLQQIYDKLVVLERDVARLVDQHDRAERIDTDHETRIRVLERGRWPLPAVAVLLSLAAFVWAVLGR